MAGLQCFAVVIPGLEPVVESELSGLSVHDIAQIDGGVEFRTSLEGLARVNLRARCVTRVWVRLGRFKAMSFPEVFNKTGRLAWERYLKQGTRISVQASCHQSRLMHSGRLAQAVFDGIARRVPGIEPAGDISTGIQRILVRICEDECMLSIDASGERLDRRGYRLETGLAPLRETLAAGILAWSGWHPDEALMLPMCGAGTLAIEAAMLGRHRAPNLEHDFAMLHWPAFKHKRFMRVYQRAKDMEKARRMHIQAADISPGIIEQAVRNACRAGVEHDIEFIQADFFRQRPLPGHASGLVLCNPPYGDRIAADAPSLYRRLGRHYREFFSGWRLAVVAPDAACERALGLAIQRRLRVRHGGKWVHVLLASPEQ